MLLPEPDRREPDGSTADIATGTENFAQAVDTCLSRCAFQHLKQISYAGDLISVRADGNGQQLPSMLGFLLLQNMGFAPEADDADITEIRMVDDFTEVAPSNMWDLGCAGGRHEMHAFTILHKTPTRQKVLKPVGGSLQSDHIAVCEHTLTPSRMGHQDCSR